MSQKKIKTVKDSFIIQKILKNIKQEEMRMGIGESKQKGKRRKRRNERNQHINNPYEHIKETL